MSKAIRTVAVVGGGLVGSGWAIVFAKAGLQVKLYDADANIRQGVPTFLKFALEDMQRAGLVDQAEIVLKRVEVVDTLEAAVKPAQYVQESVFERVDVKRQISLDIDAAMDPTAVVGSSSSGIPASDFTEECTNRSRFLIVHPVNPPHLVPVVEIVPASWTADESINIAKDLMNFVGQVPVLVRKEIEGFILNRLQGALLNEAWALYEDGYASAADIDKTVAYGLGLRWSFMGPFETIDLNAPGGIKDYSQRLAPLYHRVAQSRQTPRAWSQEAIDAADAERRSVLPSSELAARREWRDAYLMRLAAFRKQQGD